MFSFIPILWGAISSALIWLSNNLITGIIATYVTTIAFTKNTYTVLLLSLHYGTLALRFFTFSANIAFFYFIFEFITFSINLFTKITDLLNNGSDGSVFLHGTTYNILDNFFAVLDIIGFTDAFVIVQPLLLSYIVFVFTYIARKYFINLLNSTVEQMFQLINNSKVN